MMKNFIEKNEKVLMRFLWMFAILASIKSIFTDTGFDNAYTVAMSFRHLNGDQMFKYMWEPHQTSIFFTDILMWIYHLIVPSFTGVMLYLQICGTLFLGLLAFLIYKLFKPLTGNVVASLAAMFFFMFRAKQTPFPDFANLQIGFSLLCFICIVKFFEDEKKLQYLILSGICLCLEVLSYPSSVITYIPVIVLLIIFTRDKLKNILIFTVTCAVIGGTYVSYFLIKVGVAEFIGNISNIINSDSHSETKTSGLAYFYGFFVACIWIIASLAVSFAVKVIIEKIKKNKVELLPIFGICMFLSETVMLFLQRKTGIDWTCSFYILPVLLMVLSLLLGYKKMEEFEKKMWLCGALISMASFLATLVLTDLGLITIVSYMAIGGVVSFIPLRHLGEEVKIFFMAILAIIVLHRGLVIWGYANIGNVWMPWEVETIIKNGPSFGIVTDYMSAYQITYNKEDFDQYVRSDDKLFIMGGWLIDSMEFLLTDAELSNYSTIDTPIYNEKMVEYFELYPEKMPTVIAVKCWYSDLMVDPGSFAFKWVEENYEEHEDARYYRFYRKKE